jgi:hypothetical protein
MSERLELALSWNAVAAELRAGMRARAHEIPLGDLSIPVAQRDDLLEMKRAAARQKYGPLS